jgi:predicted lysophospholipase L1 biosynthesis ABC-type transport system permease subunit
VREIEAIAPGIRVRRLAGLEQILDEALARERLSAALATLFGVCALGLAAVGLYGVVAYNVSRRTSEIGIRMALGARPADAVWLVVRQTLLMTIVGVGIGVPLALVATRGIGAQLYGIGATDPRAMMSSAAAGRGRRGGEHHSRPAARIDPVKALRAD